MPAETDSTNAANLVASPIALNLPTTKLSSPSHDAVIRVSDEAGNVIEPHEHKDEFKL